MDPQPFMQAFGRVRVVVRAHEVDLHLVADALAELVGDGLRALQLLARGHQLFAVLHRPCVELRVGEFDVLGAERLGHLQDLLRVIQVVRCITQLNTIG
jgi:hypothetical protein